MDPADLTIEAVESYVSAEMQAERERWNGIREARPPASPHATQTKT